MRSDPITIELSVSKAIVWLRKGVFGGEYLLAPSNKHVDNEEIDHNGNLLNPGDVIYQC